jgi:hypothetical protein
MRELFAALVGNSERCSGKCLLVNELQKCSLGSSLVQEVYSEARLVGHTRSCLANGCQTDRSAQASEGVSANIYLQESEKRCTAWQLGAMLTIPLLQLDNRPTKGHQSWAHRGGGAALMVVCKLVHHDDDGNNSSLMK